MKKCGLLMVAMLVLSGVFARAELVEEGKNQVTKRGDIPQGMDAASWLKIQKQMKSSTLNGSEVKLMASDAQTDDAFGRTLSVAGNLALIGAAYEGTSGNWSGAAYIFERNAGGSNAWGQVRKLMASDAVKNDQFGISVSIAGDLVLVGAYGKESFTGAAYIFGALTQPKVLNDFDGDGRADSTLLAREGVGSPEERRPKKE